jgi:hypothetical protein
VGCRGTLTSSHGASPNSHHPRAGAAPRPFQADSDISTSTSQNEAEFRDRLHTSGRRQKLAEWSWDSDESDSDGRNQGDRERKEKNRKSKVVDEKRNVNNGLMGVLCRDSNPTTDPPRAKLHWGKNSDRDKMKKVRLGNNRHVITRERQLTVGIDGGDNRSGGILALSLGRHLSFTPN